MQWGHKREGREALTPIIKVIHYIVPVPKDVRDTKSDVNETLTTLKHMKLHIVCVMKLYHFVNYTK